MRKFKLKFFIGILAFTLGIVGVLSFTFGDSISHKLDVLSKNSADIEISEEYAVYSSILNEMFLKEGVKLLVISDQAMFHDRFGEQQLSSDERLQHKKRYYSSVDDDTFIDFEAKSLISSKLESKFKISINYILINENELIEKILRNEAEIEKDKKDGKYNLYDKYPVARGLIKFSKIGFNKKRNQAFVEVNFTHCGLCGSGDYVLLEKKQDVWKIKEIFNRWVS